MTTAVPVSERNADRTYSIHHRRNWHRSSAVLCGTFKVDAHGGARAGTVSSAMHTHSAKSKCANPVERKSERARQFICSLIFEHRISEQRD